MKRAANILAAPPPLPSGTRHDGGTNGGKSSAPCMNPSDAKARNFVVATPARSVCDEQCARAGKGWRVAVPCARHAARNRRHSAGADAVAARVRTGRLSSRQKSSRPSRRESFRFRMHPWFDAWVKKQLQPGDHVISSYGYANECFKFARAHGGKTFLDAGNSHPENFWDDFERGTPALEFAAPARCAASLRALAGDDGGR